MLKDSYRERHKLKRVLITGVAGFCGRHLVQRLRAEGRMSILGYDRLDEPPTNLILDDYVKGNIFDQTLLTKIVKHFNPHWIFHLAGIYKGPVIDIYQTNVLGIIHLLEVVRAQRPAVRVLIVGSAAEYGHREESALPVTEAQPCRPKGAHGLSKYISTEMTR